MANEAVSEVTEKSTKPEVRRPVSRKDMSKFSWTLKEIRRNHTAYFLVLPFMLIFFVFTVIPVVVSLALSLTDLNMLQVPDFVFFDNYIRLFLDDIEIVVQKICQCLRRIEEFRRTPVSYKI